jgi:competence protein ComEC
MQHEPATSAQISTSPASAGLSAVPLFHAAWLFAAGIAATQWLWLRPSLVLVALALLAALCGVAALRAQRIAWLPLTLMWLLLGAWCAWMEPHPAPAPQLAALSDGLLRTVEGTVVDAGPVRGETQQNLNDNDPAHPAADPEQQSVQSPSQRIDLRVSSVEVVTDSSDAQAPVAGGVRLTVRWPPQAANTTAPSSLQPFACGQSVRAIVRLLPPEIFHDPGAWNRSDYLLDQDITSTATVSIDRINRMDPIVPLSATTSNSSSPDKFFACRLSRWQHAASTRLLSLPIDMRRLPAPLRLTQDDAIMLAAMITGDRTYLTRSLRVGFERTGSFHMLVVSGFHLAIIAGFIFWLATRMRLPRIPATFLTIAASLAYALFTGFATPVQRSFWMVTLYLLGRLFYRERSPLNIIGFAALCLLALSPRSLFDASFQMTLLAVLSIAGIAAPLLQRSIHPYVAAIRDLRLVVIDAKLPPRLAQFRVTLRMFAASLQSAAHGRFAERIAWQIFPSTLRFLLRASELIVVSCIVELAMALPMAVYFHRITLFALPVNLFILPLLVILMPAALITLLVALIGPSYAVVPAMLVALPLHFGAALVRLFGSLTLADVRIPAPPLGQTAAVCALLAAAIALASIAASSTHAWPPRAAWTALILAALAAIASRPIQHPRDALLMEAIDVGQGDSLLLVTPDGKTLLIDGGGFGGGPHQAPQDFDIGEEVVSAALWSRGVRHLDAVALTHAHSDHMGGLPAVLRNFHPDELWVGNNPHFAAYDALLDEATHLHTRVRSLRAGDALSFGDTRINVLAPFRDYQPGLEPTNNDSLVLHMAYGATSVMLEGDAEAPIENAMLAEPGLESTLLKVGHHGSITSTRPEFLARVAPQWAVISCGLRNRYGHPRSEVLEELQAAKIRTFRTDINGVTCFRLDGKSVSPEPLCGRR